MAKQPSLTLTRRIKASPEEVFAAWTDPKKLGAWMGPANFTATAEIEARVGGAYHIVLRTPEGQDNHVSGTFRELVPGKKIVFSWAWHSTPERESLVTITLKPERGGTLMTFNHEQLFDEKARDEHLRGWTGSFDKLEKLYS
ncbi:MAG: SRPBCC domain-containing protein [Alphaproteobacteria bacterium]